MATVSATLKMFDSITGPLQKVTQGLNLTISAMQQMQNIANRNVNIDRTLATAKKQIASAEASILQAIDQSTKAQDKFNRAVKQSKRDTDQLLGNIKDMAATYLTFVGAQKLFQSTVGAAMEQQQIIDTFKARSRNEALGQAIYDQVSKVALRYGQDVNAALAGTRSFMSNTLDPQQLRELNILTMRLAQLNPAEGISGAAFAIKELMSGDYTSIVERFDVGRSLVSNSAARKAGQKGDVAGFIKGMDELLNKQNMTKAAFEKMLDSPAAKWQKAINMFRYNLTQAGREGLIALQPMIESLNKAFASEQFKVFFDTLSNGLRVFGQIVSTTVNFVLQNIDLLKNALFTVGIVLSVLGAQWLITWIAANWPIFAIIGAVTLLLTLLNKFGISTSQVIGYVAGVFNSFFALINNGVAYMWNALLSFAEFLANLFIDPVYAIKKLFFDMFQNVSGFFASFINGIIDGLNWVIRKMNEIGIASVSTIERINSATIESMRPESKRDVHDFSKYRKSFTDVGQAFKGGYDWGEKALTKMSNALASPMGPFQVPQNINRVDEVGKIKNKVDISSEDLKTMRELAEMKNIQNFVTLQPTVQVTGDNHYSTGYDIDTVIARIERELEEGIASSAKAVWNV